MKLSTLIAACAALTVSPVLAGDLTPPPGPVGPTMKTLTEVEPRIPIQSLPGGGTFQHVISEPGSYYLTSDLVASAGGITGIAVFAPNVTIDLNGFTLQGAGPQGQGAAAVSLAGTPGCTVRNGRIDGWVVGVQAAGSTNCVIRDLTVSNGGEGIQGSAVVIERCHAVGLSVGFRFFENGLISDSTARDCSFGFVCRASTVIRCAAESCGTGFNSFGAAHFESCKASASGIGFEAFGSGATLTNCTASASFLGFTMERSSTLTNCSAFGGTTGFRVIDRCVLRGCTSTEASQSGFEVPLITGTGFNTFEDCVATNAPTGFSIVSDAGRNLIIRCRAISPAPFVVRPNDHLAPVLSPADLATNTNPNANLGF
ncbi:MAG: right-handed parallel beta-helix repeat-containing protein [Planctomycetota bacterium]|nr:right-handed parallel beta-helix repeat-containing protein [Planctomycetota bacterium]